jgi:hypothetical protein
MNRGVRAQSGKDHVRMSPGVRAAAAALAVTVIGTTGCGVAAAQTAGSHSAVRLSNAGRARTPAGPRGSRTAWAPVPYRSAQLSVPGSWLVQIPGQQVCGLPPAGGMIFAGLLPPRRPGPGCALPRSVAWIAPAGHLPAGLRHRRPTRVVHGIPVYRLGRAPGSVVWLVPALGVRVGARGPAAGRVLATLTRSPLSAVLRRRAPAPGPAGWARRQFGGLSFATPRTWSRLRAHQWATCGTGLVPQSLLLIDATRPPAVLPCPYAIPTAAADQAQPGLTAVTGKYAAASVAETYRACRAHRGLQICLASVTGQGGLFGGVLIFSVSRPHRHPAAYFLLGLTGTGVTARAILDSVRPA